MHHLSITSVFKLALEIGVLRRFYVYVFNQGKISRLKVNIKWLEWLGEAPY